MPRHPAWLHPKVPPKRYNEATGDGVRDETGSANVKITAIRCSVPAAYGGRRSAICLEECDLTQQGAMGETTAGTMSNASYRANVPKPDPDLPTTATGKWNQSIQAERVSTLKGRVMKCLGERGVSLSG